MSLIIGGYRELLSYYKVLFSQSSVMSYTAAISGCYKSMYDWDVAVVVSCNMWQLLYSPGSTTIAVCSNRSNYVTLNKLGTLHI